MTREATTFVKPNQVIGGHRATKKAFLDEISQSHNRSLIIDNRGKTWKDAVRSRGAVGQLTFGDVDSIPISRTRIDLFTSCVKTDDSAMPSGKR